MATKSDEEVNYAVYNYLVKNGMKGAAKALLDEAKLNTKKAASASDLLDVYASYKSQK